MAIQHTIFLFSSPINLYTAKFNVSVPGFSLLQNFDAKNNTNPGLIKEYLLKLSEKDSKSLSHLNIHHSHLLTQ
jgi:hypothetical protein